MYLSLNQVSTSFNRLASTKSSGKTHLERSSAIMYFLALDAACKKKGVDVLDLHPNRTEGKDNRKLIELEFAKIALLSRNSELLYQVTELGRVRRNGNDPEKRISSNFLTVPLKKASEQSTSFYYPKRPAPLIGLGQSATGLKWGIAVYDDWHVNLPKLFTEMQSHTPFTDLAIFICRNAKLAEGDNYVDVLNKAIESRFTKSLSRFWSDRIYREKVLAKHISSPFDTTLIQFTGHNSIEGLKIVLSTKDEMKDYISYLESLLRKNKIEIKYTGKLK